MSRVIHEGPAAYVSITVAEEGTFSCLYECGENQPYERIALARFDLVWLIEGADLTGA